MVNPMKTSKEEVMQYYEEVKQEWHNLCAVTKQLGYNLGQFGKHLTLLVVNNLRY